MKKLVLSIAIAAASIGLTACDDETIKDVQQDVAANGPAVTASARVVFDPTNGVLSVPNDLLFQGSVDGTLSIPGEQGTSADNADPQLALGTQDGWSIAQPFVLAVDFPAGTSLDAASVFSPDSVKIYQATMGGDASDADCVGVERGLACKIVKELVFGVDFVAQASGNSVTVVPTKPLVAKTTYLVALTDNLKDNNGKAVAPSTTYELVKQDIATDPLGSESQLGLQLIINSFETAVSSAGVNKDNIIYTMAMTTQSTTDAVFAVKSIMAANLLQGIFPTIGIQDTGASVADILGAFLPPEQVPLFQSANYMRGSITLPYYLGIPSSTNPLAPMTERFNALCDSGATLAGLAASNPAAIPADAVSATDAQCMAISAASGLPAPGLRDLSSLFPVDVERHITKFNPVPAPSTPSDMPWIGDPGTLEVQMTTPDIAVANAVRSSLGLPPLVKPDNGWPVVMLQHGITTNKESMLLITGSFSLQGLATVAIDFPLHGSRGFDVNGDGVDDLNASISALFFANLASLPSARDNLKQAQADMLGLRFGLNFIGGVDPLGNPMDLELDTSTVTFLGSSFGAMNGMNFVAFANTSLNPDIDGMFEVKAASLNVPGAMFANFGIESPAFEILAKSNLTLGASPDFQALVQATYPDGADAGQLGGLYVQFYTALSAEQQAGLDAVFAQFTFAAETLLDSGDPISSIALLAASQTPIHLTEVIGNGVDNLPDQVVTNSAPFTPMGGTDPIITLLGLPVVSSTLASTDGSPVSGAVRFLYGSHGSAISPAHTEGVTASPEYAARATVEMQSQISAFLATQGQIILITDEEIVE